MWKGRSNSKLDLSQGYFIVSEEPGVGRGSFWFGRPAMPEGLYKGRNSGYNEYGDDYNREVLLHEWEVAKEVAYVDEKSDPEDAADDIKQGIS